MVLSLGRKFPTLPRPTLISHCPFFLPTLSRGPCAMTAFLDIDLKTCCEMSCQMCVL